MSPCVANEKGFTLLELMIVLILIGIFSGLMLGEMRGTFEDALLRSTSRKIIGAANLASSKAITLSRPYALRIEPGENQLTIGAAGERDAIEEEKLDSRIHIEVRNAVAPIEENSEEAPAEQQRERGSLTSIRFLPDGTADGREILLRDRLGVEVVLRINPVTGRIHVVEDEVVP